LFIDEPDAKFFPQTPHGGTKKEKRTKKERRGGLLKLAQLWEIEIGSLRHLFLDDFHKLFEKASQKTLRLFHSFQPGPAASPGGLLFK
jgi:hypothetical protein